MTRASTAAAKILPSTRRSSTTNSSATSPGRSTSSPRVNAANGPTASPTQTGRPRFVAGAIGPLTVSLSNSPDADDAGFRVVTFDQVKTAYAQQVRALIAGGVDLLLVETIFDSLNAKAALVAIREVFDEDGSPRKGTTHHDLRRRRARRRNHDLRPNH